MADREDDPLLERYRAAAITHGEARQAGDHRRANRAYRRIVEALHAMRAAGTETATALFHRLMADPRIEVRTWAATHALEFDPVAAEQVLTHIAAGRSTIEQFNADMVLREWRAGRLTFPP